MSTVKARARRKLWHFLADHGAPHWLWSRFLRDTWRPCSRCGIRRIGRWKGASAHGPGGRPTRHYCTGNEMREVEDMF